MIYVLTSKGIEKVSELESIGKMSSGQTLLLGILKEIDKPEGISTSEVSRSFSEVGRDRFRRLHQQGYIAVDYPEEDFSQGARSSPADSDEEEEWRQLNRRRF